MSTTNNTTNLPAIADDLKTRLTSFPEMIESNLPKLIKWNQKADAALNNVPDKIEDDDQAEDVNAILAAVKEVYDACKEKRTEITEVTDTLKKMLMDYERPFNPNDDKSKYNEKRKVLAAYHQEKHDKAMREKQEALKRKESDNYRIDLKAKMLSELNTMLTDAVKKIGTGSREYFDAAKTIENFDERSKMFIATNPKLKKALYDSCFVVDVLRVDLMSAKEFEEFRDAIQQEESYDKWNTLFVEQASPIINEWRAKLPDLRARLAEIIELESKNTAEAEEMRRKQREDDDLKERERQEQLDRQAAEQKAKIEEEAGMNKMSNEFAAQAVTQQIEDTGKTKLVLKFNDPKTTPKAFMEILYHVFSHPDFPGIQKRDAKKKLVVDDKGRPEYIAAVQWWIDFFIANCDANITGATFYEDAKITVRK